MALEEPAPPAPTTGPTATWGTQHFDRAPTADELQKISGSEQQQKGQTPAEQQEQQRAPPRAPSVGDAVKTIQAKDFLNVYQTPCARQGFLAGIGGGAVAGMLRYVVGGNIPKSTNWAVGLFALGGIVSYEVCQASRRAERETMKRVVEVYDRKQAALKEREAERKRKAREEAKEAEERAKKRWYKFW